MFQENQQSTTPKESFQKLEAFLAAVEAMTDKMQAQSRKLNEANKELLSAKEQIELWKNRCQELNLQLKSLESAHQEESHLSTEQNGATEGLPSTYLPQQPPSAIHAIERKEVQALLKEIEECIALVSMTT